MIDKVSKADCTGCTACFNSCPTKCIQMQMDYDGFYYPNINHEECIGCNMCEKVCPVVPNKKKNRSNFRISYACQNKDENIRKLSTSGGIFGAIAEYVLDEAGSVWGAGFNEDGIVEHKKANKKKELKSLFGSKYVQSQLKDTFWQIKEELRKKNTPVLFVGTPCQVEGLYNILDEKELSNLILVDLVCYGVPSPGLYEKWLEYLHQKYDSKVKYINFRDKKYGYAGVNVKIFLQNGKIVEDCVDAKSYGKTMFSHIGLRTSCYKCDYRSRKKVSDFTIGDFWQIGEYAETLDDDKGTSILHINSDKGKLIFEKLNDAYLKSVFISEITDESLEKLIEKEAHSIHMPMEREKFFGDFNKLSYKQLIEKYLPATLKDHIANKAKPIICRTPFSRKFFKSLKKWKMKRGK